MMASFSIASLGSMTDGVWYMDSRETHHLTPDLSSMTSPIPFQGNENIMVGNGKTINISHIGNISIPTHSKFMKPRHVMHTLEISKQLISVTKLCYGNKAYTEFHPTFLLVKDQCSKKVLLQGPLDHGLYKLNIATELLSLSSTLNPSSSLSIQVFVSKNKPSNWHGRLGYLSSRVLSLALNSCNDSF